jgi:hypothetical protein
MESAKTFLSVSWYGYLEVCALDGHAYLSQSVLASAALSILMRFGVVSKSVHGYIVL